MICTFRAETLHLSPALAAAQQRRVPPVCPLPQPRTPACLSPAHLPGCASPGHANSLIPSATPRHPRALRERQGTTQRRAAGGVMSGTGRGG